MSHERIEHENGVYVCRREPVAVDIGGDEPCVVVRFTHDIGKAAELAWPVWQQIWEDRRLGKASLDWGRQVNWDMILIGFLVAETLVILGGSLLIHWIDRTGRRGR